MKYVISAFLIMAFGVLLLLRNNKTKEQLSHATGYVTYYGKTLIGHNDRHEADSAMRYLRINTFPQAFSFFIGKKRGDFKPAFERLDDIKMGDTLTIYFTDPLPFQAGRDDSINTDGEFVDRHATAYFVRGNKDKWGAYFFLLVGGLLLIFLPSLKEIS